MGIFVIILKSGNSFKVFVANPNKAQPIQDILLKNKDRLVEFLTQFHTDRTGELFLLRMYLFLEDIFVAAAFFMFNFLYFLFLFFIFYIFYYLY